MKLLPPGKGEGVREFSFQVARRAHVKETKVLAATEIHRVVITTNIYNGLKLGTNGKIN
jgi:hypothetical protein